MDILLQSLVVFLIIVSVWLLYELAEHQLFSVSHYLFDVTKCNGSIFYKQIKNKDFKKKNITDNVSEKVRCVLISDFHNNFFIDGDRRLIGKIRKIKPDFIILAGDMVNKRSKSDNNAIKFIKQLSDISDIYYAPGNHEEKLKENESLRYNTYLNCLESKVYYLCNSCHSKKYNGISFNIAGLSIEALQYKKTELNTHTDGSIWLNNLKKQEDKINILIAHSPDFANVYSKSKFEFIMSGHIHGGLLRLPFIGGIVSPKLGLPKYSEGVYEVDESNLIVSRGLGSHTIPLRFFNRTEFSIIDFCIIEDKFEK